MKWMLGVAAAVAVLAGTPATAVAAPTITLTPGCVQSGEILFYGVDVSIGGLPPNAPFQGSISFPGGGSAGPASLVADATGAFHAGFFGSEGPGTFTVTVTYAAGTLSQSADVTSCPAPLPTSKEQCKNGGWHNYGDTFKNQGECVAFVERGPKP